MTRTRPQPFEEAKLLTACPFCKAPEGEWCRKGGNGYLHPSSGFSEELHRNRSQGRWDGVV